MLPSELITDVSKIDQGDRARISAGVCALWPGQRRTADDMLSVVVSSKLEQSDTRQSVHRQLSQVSKHQIMVVLEENF